MKKTLKCGDCRRYDGYCFRKGKVVNPNNLRCLDFRGKKERERKENGTIATN
jgi:hypothetical protein